VEIHVSLVGHKDLPARSTGSCAACRAGLDTMVVRGWLAKLERDGVGASTRAKAYRLLSRILGTAIESGYLTRNPCTIRGAGRSNFTRRVWIPATRAAGVEGLRFHDLRHTAASLAVAAGASTRELMVRMGHSSSAAALCYQHVMGGRDAAIAAALDELVRAASTKSEGAAAAGSGTRVTRTGQPGGRGKRR
jgi:hypothetical protein